MKTFKNIIFFILGLLGVIAVLLGLNELGSHIEMFLFNEAPSEGDISWIGGLIGLGLGWCLYEKKKEGQDRRKQWFREAFATYKSKIPYYDPDRMVLAENDFKSKVENLF